MALTPGQRRHGFRLGDRLVQPARNTITGSGGEAHVEPRAMAVLLCLAERAGEVISRDEINDAVWGRAVVTDQALTNCISELRQHLGDDRSEPRFIETVPKRGYRLIAPVEPAPRPKPSDGSPALVFPGGARSLSLAAALLLLAGIVGVVLWLRFGPGSDAAHPSVVLLPFENIAGEERLDYLRLALPDEITTLLTQARNLAVRPFEPAKPLDAPDAARARSAKHVVTGHYYLENDGRLAVAIEAQDARHERLMWRARISVPADDLLTLRREISKRVREGLIPALGASAMPPSDTPPADPEAYRLYLRSLALPKHPGPIQRAIRMLQQSVDLDPDFASAWYALGRQLYEHGTYGEGGAAAREQALAAYRRALSLDPELIPAAVGLVVLRVESGALVAAHDEALRLVEDFPASSQAHLALAYVYRFGGMLERSQRHCETALGLDPENPRLRSCAYSYLYAGELARVQIFLDLDQGSYFSHWGTVLLNLRRSDDVAALNATRRVSEELPTRLFMEPCLEGRRGTSLDDVAEVFIRHWQGRPEPELGYALAPMLHYCGRTRDALDFVARSVEKNFCSFPALDLDPIWSDLRNDPEWKRLREKAIACHERFRNAVAPTAMDPLTQVSAHFGSFPLPAIRHAADT